MSDTPENDEYTPDPEELEEEEEEVTEEETSTPAYSATPTASDSAPEPNGTAPAEAAKISAYKKRMMELGREGQGAEIPVELADMMRAAAKQQGDIALTAWIRIAWATAVNAANLTHEVEVTDANLKNYPEHKVGDKFTEDWKFDLASLEATQARTSTRGMTEEQKKKKKEEKQAEEKDQKALVKRLLEEHRAKLKGAAS